MELHVSISNGNSKMGAIPSVSLPALITCSVDACKFCGKKCYAAKISRLRKTVANAYQRNLDILKNEPEKFWREVNAAVAVSRFFRFGVSGDIYDDAYLENIVKTARSNKHCQILVFTKKFDICNKYLEHHKLPSNLHLIFSGWVGMKMFNPYHLPEAHVMLKNGETSASDGAKYCSGNCYECAVNNHGCWTMKKGDQVIFREH